MVFFFLFISGYFRIFQDSSSYDSIVISSSVFLDFCVFPGVFRFYIFSEGYCHALVLP